MADDAAASSGQLSHLPSGEPTKSDSCHRALASGDDVDDSEADALGDGADAQQRKPMASPRAALMVVLVVTGLVGCWASGCLNRVRADQQRALFLEAGREGAINRSRYRYPTDPAIGDRTLFRRLLQTQSAVRRCGQEGAVQIGGHSHRRGDQIGDPKRRPGAGRDDRADRERAADQAPRVWRMRISVQKVGGQAKVSKIEFVP
jgi:Mce-associated membrane protein